jgi:hypothetical protein
MMKKKTIPDQLHDDEFDDDLGGNGAWGNILGEPINIKSPTKIYLFISFQTPTQPSLSECSPPMLPLPLFLLPTPPLSLSCIFDSTIYRWIALILWVCSVITRSSNHNEPNDVELAISRTITTTTTTPSFTHHFTFVAITTSSRIFIT